MDEGLLLQAGECENASYCKKEISYKQNEKLAVSNKKNEIILT